MRAQRRALDPNQCETLAEQLIEHVAASRWFIHSHHIAFYLPNDAEIDLWPLLAHAWQQQKACYLPVLGLPHENRLWFLPFGPKDKLITNRFGIPEPVHKRRQRLLKPRALDLILMPLVAFDKQGHRLGMGGGFYDRTLSFLQNHKLWRKPKLLGIAYEFQCMDTLPSEPWDIPLDGIATEQGIHAIKSPSS